MNNDAAVRFHSERAAQRGVLRWIRTVRNADAAACNLPALYQLVINLHCRIRRQCKTKACRLPRLRNDGGVDANDLSGHIHERAAAVTRIDRCVGLQEALEIISRTADFVSTFGADNPVCDGVIEVERTADRQHPIADLHRIGIPHLRHRQVTAGFDLDDRQIRVGVAADELPLIFGFVFEANHDLRGLIHDVMVRHDISRFVDNEARAEISHFLIAIRQIRSAEKVEEVEWVEFSRIRIRIRIPIIAVVGRIVSITTVRAIAYGTFRRGLGIDIDHSRCEIRRDL